MLVNTVRFGELELEADQIITFEQGLPGFEHFRTFTLLTPDPELPFTFLQSLEDGEVAFILTNPFLFYDDYEFELTPETVEQLQVAAPKDVTVWSIVSITDELATSTINLLAPVVIHENARLGKQVILHGSGYVTKHPLIPLKPVAASPETAAGKEARHARIDT
ncbi:flagellar assembly protein FliW [Paenibacillus sp. HJGM_3]|uniref:flagellar assembly protein FliW n=1 Tax=Paenibacillus sp. HJGM_3 TaxID=3379816 RepID=UPI00385C9F2C